MIIRVAVRAPVMLVFAFAMTVYISPRPAQKPKILILDDSTSAVDTKTDALIRQAFREEIPDTTKFIIAQRISSVQDADHILVLDDGHISAYGTHEEQPARFIRKSLHRSRREARKMPNFNKMNAKME